MSFTTAGDIVNQAAVEVGLRSVQDPYTATDANIVQMCQLLKSLGREIVHMRDWNILRRERVFTTVAGQSSYPLPADYHNMVDQTWWNRTNRLPVGGPVSAQEWQYLKGRLVGIVFNVLFRPMQNAIVLYPTGTAAPGGFEIVYEYQSEWWVKQYVGAWAASTAYTTDRVVDNGGNAYVCTTAGQSALVGPTGTDFVIVDGTCVWSYIGATADLITTTDAPTASDDQIIFDPLLMIRGLKLAFLKAKGFDTTSAQQDYNTTLEMVKGHDAPSPILNATRRWNPIVDPLIGGQSVPVTGFGV